MKNRKISSAVINRMPRYYRYLGELEAEGEERISSMELSKRMRVTASQIRQDFNNFGGFGQQGYGYNVSYLRSEIGKILGLNKEHKMIIVGCGNLGKALANYAGLSKNGFVLVGLFDNKKELEGKEINGVKVRMIDELPQFLKENEVDLAALTVPRQEAESVAWLLVDNGVEGILNFSRKELNMQLPSHVKVQNVYLMEGLMLLSYAMEDAREDTKTTKE